MNLVIELTPFQALQICRWKEFISDAVKDSDCDKYDTDGIISAIVAIDNQVKKKITLESIDDAFAERAAKEITQNL